VSEPVTVDDARLQHDLEAVVRAYAARILGEPQGAVAPFPPGSDITPTEALVVAGAILRAAEISSFELAAILNL
jgi:hypothetical protein